jgi:DNA-binding transcriptional ArsR family regulator
MSTQWLNMPSAVARWRRDAREGGILVNAGHTRRAAKPSRLNAVFAALADPTRRAIVETLSRGEARVTEVAEPFAMSLNAVSKHIKVLEEIGLVRRRVVGREHYLTVEAQPLHEVEKWIVRTRRFWNTRLDAMEALLREREAMDGDADAK